MKKVCSFLLLLSVASAWGIQPAAKCLRLMELKSQLKFVLTEEGQQTLSSAIEEIRAFPRIGGVTQEQVHGVIDKLLPLLLRTGLGWTEIVALATPERYEVYAAGLPVLNNLHGSLHAFFDETTEENRELVGGITSREFAAVFFENLKAHLTRPTETAP